MRWATSDYTLVTGGAGFLGSHVIRELLKNGRTAVVVLDDLSGGFRDNVPPNVTFIEGSTSDHTLISSLFEKYRFRYVYHLAAYAAEGLSHFIRRFNYTNNLIGSVNLINEAVRVKSECFVFTSSIAVYGAIEPPMLETMRPCPEDPYGIAKLAVEMDLRAANSVFGLKYVIFRPHNIYGEYQNLADPYRNVIGIFMNQVLNEQPLTVFGDGNQSRAFSYVGDVAPVIACSPWVPEASNETFNVGADEAYTVNQLAAAVAEAMGRSRHPITHLPARHEVLHAFSDHSKARAVFGAAAQTSLGEGLKRMAFWARRAPLRPMKGFADIEVDTNMPPSWRKYQARAAN